MNVIRSGVGSFDEGGWCRLHYQQKYISRLQFYPEIDIISFVFLLSFLSRVNFHGIVTAHQGTLSSVKAKI